MAAPNGTLWGATQGGYGRIGLYVNTVQTDTQYTVTVEVWFWSKYSVSDTANTFYYNNLGSAGSATTSRGSVSIKTTVDSGSGWSTSNQQKLATYSGTYTRGTSDVTRYLYAKLINIDVVGAAMYANTTVTIPKLASYTVTYNANGGSSAPSAQTKWFGKALTLSTAKPTRTGYTFQGWATSSTGSVAYASGANYTANSAATLYAVWKANTYSVKYNANGGTGAPGAQTKTYGVTLKLSTTIPTREKYNFLGWSNSASATTPKYAAGGNYTTNSAVTLYAVWELAYVAPRISNLSISRCSSDGTISDDGTYAFISCNWVSDESVSSITVKWKTPSASSWSSETITASGTSGSINQACCGGSLSTDSTYVVSITVSDASGSSTQQRTVSSAFFTIDFKAGGKGVAVGKSAELENVFDVGFQLKLSGGIVPIEISEGTDLNTITTPGLYRCHMSVTAATLVNSPTDVAFVMEVLPNHNVTQRIIEYRSNDLPRSFMRNYYNNAWGVWWEHVPRQNKISTAVNLLELSSGETYTFEFDGYLVARASYRSGYYVNCTLFGSNNIGIDISVTSGSAGNMQGNPSNITFVRKGMYVGNVATNATNYNVLEFRPVY